MADIKVGFIGLGVMGAPMCNNIIKSGYEVFAYDNNEQARENAKTLGATVLSSAAEVAKSADVTILMLPNGDIVKSVVTEIKSELISNKTLVDMSTINLSSIKDEVEELKSFGVSVLDAPVVKSKAAAISGDLGILVGGERADYERLLPLFKTMGKNVIYMGKNGSGYVAKVCHNMLVGEISVAVSETLTLAKKQGLDVEDFVTAVSYGGGQNFYMDGKAKPIVNEDFTCNFALGYEYKDLNLAKELEESSGLNLTGFQNALEKYREGVEAGYSKDDFCKIIKTIK